MPEIDSPLFTGEYSICPYLIPVHVGICESGRCNTVSYCFHEPHFGGDAFDLALTPKYPLRGRSTNRRPRDRTRCYR